MSNKKKIRTPKFRGSYAKIANPSTNKEGKLIYEISGIFDIAPQFADNWKNDKNFHELILLAANTAQEKFGTTKGIQYPFRDNDSYDEDTLSNNPAYHGKLVIPFRSYGVQPDCAILDKNGKPERTEDLSVFYSGAYYIATIQAYAYGGKKSASGEPIKKGVAFGLSSLLKVAEGEHLSAFNDVMEDFNDFDGKEYITDSSELFDSNPAAMI